MRRNNSVGSIFTLGASALVLAACGFVAGDGGEVGVRAADDTAATTVPIDRSRPIDANEQPASDEAPVVEVLLVGDDSGEPMASPSTATPSSAVVGSVGSTSAPTPIEPTSPTTPPAPQTTATVPVTAGSEPTSTSAASTTSSTTSSIPASTTQPTTSEPPTSQPPTSQATGGGSALTYKGILAGGDDSIIAFDNARRAVKDLFLAAGVQSENLIELSRRSEEQVNGVRATSVAGIEQALTDLNVGEGDACIVFLTSHGNQQAWFISGAGGLTPDALDRILTASCGARPTVALVSACYSGIFVGPLARPNRVVLTAASATNTSFGCSPEATYTYWDGCLITHFPQASTWEDLYRRVTGCIETKEAAAGVTPSRPMAHFGAEVTNLSILNR